MHSSYPGCFFTHVQCGNASQVLSGHFLLLSKILGLFIPGESRENAGLLHIEIHQIDQPFFPLNKMYVLPWGFPDSSFIFLKDIYIHFVY